MEAGMRYWKSNETDNKGGIVVKTMKEERKYQKVFSDKCIAHFSVCSKVEGVLFWK